MTLFFFLAACAHSTSLHKGDEAAANNNWTAAYDAYAIALQSKPSSATPFHSLQATSQALQPMHNVESVRNAVVGIQFSPTLTWKKPPRST